MKTPFARHRVCSDAEVVAAFRCGNRRIQQMWYERCRAAFRAAAPSLGGMSDFDCDDLFQDAFVTLWEKLESGRIFVDADGALARTSPDGIVAVPDLLAFFMRTVRNKYLERFRSRNINVELREETTPAGDVFAELYWDEDPEVEKDRIVTACLMALPASCLEILTLFYFKKLSLEQILRLRPENNSYDGLKTRKAKCMANLRKRIAEKMAKAGLS